MIAIFYAGYEVNMAAAKLDYDLKYSQISDDTCDFFSGYVLEKTSDFKKMHGHSFMVMRENGYDFGTWKSLLELYYSQKYDQIVLLNSSLLISDYVKLKRCISVSSNYDVSYLATSNERGYHGQSYYISFARSAISVALEFFKCYKPKNDREYTIVNGELGLSKCLIENDFEFHVLYRNKPFIKYFNFLLQLGFRNNIKGIFDSSCINPILYDSKYFQAKFGLKKK
jgi:hypothetical protein